MTRALLCPGPDLLTMLSVLAALVAVPAAGAVVGVLVGEVVKAVRRTRLR